METKMNKTQMLNGVDVTRLFETIDHIKAMPTLAKFRLRADNRWLDGGHNRTSIKDFYGAGENRNHIKPFSLDADEPEILLGRDLGPNPVEYLLKALAACVTTTLVYHAAARGIVLEEVESTLEGDIDLHGFLGLDPNVRRGFESIRMNFKIKADATDEQLQDIVKLGPTFSPVYDSITNGVAITVTGERK